LGPRCHLVTKSGSWYSSIVKCANWQCYIWCVLPYYSRFSTK